MMRTLIFLAATLTLTGCMKVDSILPSSDKAPTDTSFYLLDTKYKFLCLGNTQKCRDLTKIVSSRSELRPIEKAYGQKVTGPNYPVTLARMLITPADGSYTTKPIGDEGRFVHVPINDKTQLVWDTLTSIEEGLFSAGS